MSISTLRSSLALTLLCLLTAPLSQAQTTFTQNTTISSNIVGSVTVMADPVSGLSPTINLVAGGSISGPNDGLTAYDSSTINISGGNIGMGYGGGVALHDSSTMNMSSGILDSISMQGLGNVLHMTGGTVTGTLGGGIGDSYGTVYMSGGSVYAIGTYSGTINVSGGNLTYLNNFYGVENVSGGNISNLSCADGNENITGGVFGSIVGSDSSIINVYGGTLSSSITGEGFCTYNFYGQNLSSTFDHGVYSLSGTLEDGTSLNGITLSLEDDSNGHAQFNLITASEMDTPEPSGVLAGLGFLGMVVGGALRARIRKARKAL